MKTAASLQKLNPSNWIWALTKIPKNTTIGILLGELKYLA